MRDEPPSSSFIATDGDAYELQMGRWSRRLAPLFIHFAGITGAVRVLDVGCGTGNLSAYLAEDRHLIGVCGVDRSAEYIAHAQLRSKDPRVQFCIGDASALPFPNAAFDHTVSMLALQFVAHPDVALREMRRVTRPGGIVAATTWDTRGGFVALRMIFDAAAMLDQRGRDARAAAYTRSMSRPGDLERVWQAAGLENVVQDALTIRMDFASFSDFWTPMEGREGPVAEFIGSLEPEARVNLREAVLLSYLDGEQDGPRSYAATAWVAKGEVPG